MPVTDKPTVSVIIPCFNGEAFLREAVDSALGQTYPDKEVIVVDDGSTDGSARILDEYGDRIRVVHQANAGLPGARNSGIRICRGRLLAFLDADDYWEPQFLSKMIAALDSSGADIAYCGWQNIGVPGGRGMPFVPPDYSQVDKVELLLRNARWPVHGAVSRTEVITAVGSFDASLTSCADFDLWLRVGPFCKLVLVPEVLVYYRFHEGPQITKNHVRMARNVRMIQKRFIADHPQAVAHLSRARLAELTEGELLKRAYQCYWRRDLESARVLFRMVMRSGYGSAHDWKYMLPALLPLPLHRALIQLMDSTAQPADQLGSSGRAVGDE